MRQQFHAGYLLESVRRIFQEKRLEDWKRQLFALSHYNVYGIELRQQVSSSSSLFGVLNNLISRGLPTLPSLFLEEYISNKLGFAEKHVHDKTGAIYFVPNDVDASQVKLLERSLYAIAPLIKSAFLDESVVPNSYDSDFEKLFYEKVISNSIGVHCTQLFERQVPFTTILDNSDKHPYDEKYKEMFKHQRVDFALRFPVQNDVTKGVIIEVDGSQHNTPNQRYLDKKREAKAADFGWETIRIGVKEVRNLRDERIHEILDLLDNKYIRTIKHNFESPILNETWGSEAQQLILSPLCIARLQKTIAIMLQQGVLDLNASSWKITVVERDVPCAHLAIEDLFQVLEKLYSLAGEEIIFPKIELTVFSNQQFINSPLHMGKTVSLLSELDEGTDTDLLIDISMLQYDVYENTEDPALLFIKFKKRCFIRNARFIETPRIIQSGPPVHYSIPDEEQPADLLYFLQNLFRKTQFREGQIEIIKRTLTMQHVIALLPTGAGKSLTYQLSALLEPGIVLIVDPLKSLMKDQNDNLLALGIDATTFINSSLKSAAERRYRSQKMVHGHYQFIFISPERLLIPEFREYVSRMYEVSFAYCVVDEAHCVSEWGHDFRTAYLRLGANVRKYCKAYNKGNLPIVGLTGTASFDVLADVQRELGITDELAVIAPSKYAREELNFRLIDVGIPQPNYEQERRQSQSTMELKKAVAHEKQAAIVSLLKELPRHSWDDEQTYNSISEFLGNSSNYPNSGIVFCPHVGWEFGVKKIYEVITSRIPELTSVTDMYASGLEEESGNYLEISQERFKQDKTKLLVATKAFGMGIDKPNIRFTIHFNMPQSIESYYQEAGRAGRDKDKSYCYILYSPAMIEERGENITVDKSLMRSFYNNSFKGAEKEKALIWELMNRVTFPKYFRIKELETIIQDEIDENIRLRLWQGTFARRDGRVPKRLYINADEYPKGYGYIELYSSTLHPEDRPDRKIVSKREAHELLEKCFNRLQELKNPNETFLEWITYCKDIPDQDGVEKILKTVDLGTRHKVVIGFKNKSFADIAETLADSNDAWDEALVSKAYPYTVSGEEFFENLKREFKKKTDIELGNRIDSLKEKIISQYVKIRDVSETFKAIYRMSVVGLIDDYEVDYKAETLIVYAVKKRDEDYIQQLVDYIGRYVSASQKARLRDDILAHKGKSVIQKCVGYLIDFTYSKIAKKRLEASTVMETAIQTGLDGGNFEEFINTYFDSKYTPSLREFLYDYSFDIIWEYLRDTKGEPDSIAHLRGACDRLLIENPENPVLLLLRAFAKLLSRNYNTQDMYDDFDTGWKYFCDDKQWSREERLHELSKFYELLFAYDQTTEWFLEPYFIDEHLTWLKQFNYQYATGGLSV